MRPHILVVEDDKAIAMWISTVLAKKGYGVSVASDGQQALDYVNQQPPSLILLDWRLPGMNGSSFLKVYAQRPHPLAPVIVMSASATLLDETLTRHSQSVLIKPFDYDALVATVKKHLPDDMGDQVHGTSVGR